MRFHPSPVPRHRVAACAAPFVAGVLLIAAAPVPAISNGSCIDVEGAKRDDGANQTWLFKK